MTELMTLSIVAIATVAAGLVVWAIMSQREARLVDAAKAESAALLAAAQAREQSLEESKQTMAQQMENVFQIAASNAFTAAVKDADEKKESSAGIAIGKQLLAGDEMEPEQQLSS